MPVETIKPSRWPRVVLGFCLLSISAIPGVPVFFALYYDGLSSVFNWPSLLNWLSAFAAFFIVFGVYILTTPDCIDAEVQFFQGGFHLRSKWPLLKQHLHNLHLRDVLELDVMKAPRNGDGITFKLADEQKVSLAIRLVRIETGDVLERLHQSAENAGF